MKVVPLAHYRLDREQLTRLIHFYSRLVTRMLLLYGSDSPESLHARRTLDRYLSIV